MSRFRHLPKNERYLCRECGKSAYGNYFVSTSLCKQCAAKRRKRAPTRNVTLGENLVVTNYVETRLKKTDSMEIASNLPSKPQGYYNDRIALWATLAVCWGTGILYGLSDLAKPNPSGLKWIIGLAWFFIPILVASMFADKFSGPRTQYERRVEGLVHNRTLRLAHERARTIQEREVFYSSPEWKLLRDTVISEEGRRCGDCGIFINNAEDITVDHILPRSKFHALALDRKNLRVLCRRCNSAKGNRV